MRRTRLAYSLAILTLAALVAWSLSLTTAQKPNPSGPAPTPTAAAETAPELNITTKSGTIKLTKLRGKLVLIDAWATWCTPCRESMPFLETMHRRYRAKGLEIVGLAMEEHSLKDVDAYARAMGITYTIGQLSNPQEFAPYDNGGIPRMILVDREGKIRWETSGFGPSLEPEIEDVIKALL
jgi:cytochrome c biogenesis protein CcmG, thiol:disulfide interchange protein DsbE